MDADLDTIDKGYASAPFEAQLAERGIELIRPARRNERPRRGARQLKPLRQIIESISAHRTPSSAWFATEATAPKASWSEFSNGSSP
jgi:hypothetical protein